MGQLNQFTKSSPDSIGIPSALALAAALLLYALVLERQFPRWQRRLRQPGRRDLPGRCGTARARIDSAIPPTKLLENSQIILSDSLGNQLLSFSPNNQMQMVGTITNDQNFKQKFVYLFQVKNSNDYVESISWIQGELSPKQSLNISQSWIPKKSGIYIIETFVWNSLSNPMILAPVMSTSIVVE